ncbi:LIC12162 family protein [Alphaproteobacteria bacterium]|nr:LIC12162 family protein [Alphaproteobacteria bacterium]
MASEKRYLITTADVRTWKFDRSVVFLGEWCCVYSRKTIWEKMDAVVASPYGLGLAKKDADYAFANELQTRTFVKFCDLLNQHHGTQYSQRFWKIVLGHWYRRAIDVLLNRVNALKQCLNEYDVSGTTVATTEAYSLATSDSYSAIWAVNDDVWNCALTGRILGLLEGVKFPIEYLKGDINDKIIFEFEQSVGNMSVKKRILLLPVNIIFNVTKIFSKKNDGIIISSYLPLQKEIELCLALGQFPRKWFSPNLKITEKPDRFIRERLSSRFKSQSGNDLEFIITSLLFELLPVCFLEGFKNLLKIANKQPWPRSPKFIFTCNNFDTDEIFKIWTAQKIEKGVKYFSGQHGNHYGTHRYVNPSVEEETADKFLTWGWTDGLTQHQPAFIFKTVGSVQKKRKFTSGGLVLIEASLDHRIYTWDNYFEFGEYFREQQDFASRLSEYPKQNLTVRLFAGHRDLVWDGAARWNEFDPTIRIDDGSSKLSKLIADSRLVVHGYDSTGVLETMSLNIPTLAFWPNGFDLLRESAKPFYQLLVDAGIVHLSPETAAKQVNAIWNCIDDWWFSAKVQQARSEFCSRYARESISPVRELKQILLGS